MAGAAEVVERYPLSGACRVWWSTPAQVGPGDVALLDAVERRRLADIQRPGNRTRFLCAAALLRRLVADATGLAAPEVDVDRSCERCAYPHGRPKLVGLDLYASIAHSADRVGVALTGAGPVGIDVEQVVDRDIGRYAARILGEGEQASGPAEFYRYWTRKESVVKATGAGITAGLRRVRVSGPDEPPRLLSYPGMPAAVVTMRDLSPGDGYVAALTVLGADSCPVEQRWCDEHAPTAPRSVDLPPAAPLICPRPLR